MLRACRLNETGSSTPRCSVECMQKFGLNKGLMVPEEWVETGSYGCVGSTNFAHLGVFTSQIYIRDVKSSNGTFVNAERLSGEGLESEPYELKSEDIVVSQDLLI